jgi:replicative DNA helicase
MKREYDKPIPANVDAEKTILGAVLLECSCSDLPERMIAWETTKALSFEDFLLDSHRRIYLRMSELIEAGSSVDIVTLANKLSEEKEVEMIGGVAYLASLTEGLPRRPSIRDYVRIVKAKSLLRQLIGCCSQAVDKAYNGEPGFEIINVLRERLDEIEQSARQGIRTQPSGGTP